MSSQGVLLAKQSNKFKGYDGVRDDNPACLEAKSNYSNKEQSLLSTSASASASARKEKKRVGGSVGGGRAKYNYHTRAGTISTTTANTNLVD